MNMFKRILPASLLLASSGAFAGGLAVELEIPELNVAEYHKPYVAVWVTNKETKEVSNGAVWYQIDADGEGEKWLKDMRLWWRRSGRSLDMPIDGVTGATEKPGSYSIDLSHVASSLTDGEYQLFVEAAREVGGRELLSVDFSWPVNAEQTLTAKGNSELGAIAVTITP